MQVLVLEPDYWRFLGISQVLKSEPGIKFLGEEDHTKILSLKSPPPELEPDVVLVSHSLIVDFQTTVLDHLQSLFPKANLLVDGYDGQLDAVADVLRAGAKGYFLLSSDPPKLFQALGVVEKGYIWAPREAVAMMASRLPPEPGAGGKESGLQVSPYDMSILKLLEQGLSNKEIAQNLGVAEVTVKSHMTKLFRKFGVRSRLGLLAYAVNHRLIPERGVPRDPHQRS